MSAPCTVFYPVGSVKIAQFLRKKTMHFSKHSLHIVDLTSFGADPELFYSVFFSGSCPGALSICSKIPNQKFLLWANGDGRQSGISHSEEWIADVGFTQSPRKKPLSTEHFPEEKTRPRTAPTSPSWALTTASARSKYWSGTYGNRRSPVSTRRRRSPSSSWGRSTSEFRAVQDRFSLFSCFSSLGKLLGPQKELFFDRICRAADIQRASLKNRLKQNKEVSQPCLTSVRCKTVLEVKSESLKKFEPPTLTPYRACYQEPGTPSEGAPCLMTPHWQQISQFSGGEEFERKLVRIFAASSGLRYCTLNFSLRGRSFHPDSRDSYNTGALGGLMQSFVEIP